MVIDMHRPPAPGHLCLSELPPPSWHMGWGLHSSARWVGSMQAHPWTLTLVKLTQPSRAEPANKSLVTASQIIGETEAHTSHTVS
jgi:hypothetical protein